MPPVHLAADADGPLAVRDVRMDFWIGVTVGVLGTCGGIVLLGVWLNERHRGGLTRCG